MALVMQQFQNTNKIVEPGACEWGRLNQISIGIREDRIDPSWDTLLSYRSMQRLLLTTVPVMLPAT